MHAKCPSLSVVYRKVDDLIPYARNARTHSADQVARIAASIKEFGWTNPILVDGENGIIAGHGRLAAARKLGLIEVPTIELSGLSETQKRAYILADNKLALDAGWDYDALRIELDELTDLNFDLSLTGFSPVEVDDLLNGGSPISEGTPEEIKEEGREAELSEFEERYGANKGSGALIKNYLAPPFSVIDTRQGYWQERERYWDAKIKDFGESRDGKLFGLPITGERGLSTVSIFDPFLAEIICRWFLPKPEGNAICDPFAGGMFGYVAASLGNTYTGTELRQEQADLNNSRVEGMSARYICDDGRNIASHIEAESQDLVFSCPPYFNLERYSDLENDASNQSWEGFCSILHDALSAAMRCLKPNRFAVIVMSNVRDKKGFYLDICEEIKRTMAESGACLYNEIILLNQAASAPLRAAQIFRNRKVTRVHQEVLVFYKGDPQKIQNDFPVLKFEDEQGNETAEDSARP